MIVESETALELSGATPTPGTAAESSDVELVSLLFLDVHDVKAPMKKITASILRGFIAVTILMIYDELNNKIVPV
ncbi:hypothetical protein WBG78_14100 [Chryseolinea sp. T2]|uniref:hypothetical protein n=1 Tax=Chryseolinea sp. T2 TaxID=3129255 RepID=UPI003077BE85